MRYVAAAQPPELDSACFAKRLNPCILQFAAGHAADKKIQTANERTVIRKLRGRKFR
jgi:hypothetical protein